MGADEIKTIFKRTHKSLNVLKIADYDDSNYIIEAVEDEEKVDYNAPFYLMNKESKVVIPFSPLENIEKFRKAFKDRLIEE